MQKEPHSLPLETFSGSLMNQHIGRWIVHLPGYSNVVPIVSPCQQGYDVILDQTLFFPEEGGQNCDQGTINGHVVDYVSIQDDVIHHFLKQSVEGKVKGEINFAYRYSNMQNHSGEHILSGLINQVYGYNNVGF